MTHALEKSNPIWQNFAAEHSGVAKLSAAALAPTPAACQGAPSRLEIAFSLSRFPVA